MDALQRYLEGECNCPSCGGKDTEQGEFNVVGANAERPCHCNVCGNEWTAVYVLSDIRAK
jgi:formate dehydrogenase maturation protein FdhE